MRTLVAATTTALIAALCALPTAAYAEDQRPCVSRREFNGLHGDYTRAALEARWEVASRGVAPGHYRFDVTYLRCGYSADEGGVVVSYRKRDLVAVRMGRWKVDGITPHGHL
jgi:hypothetical protein